MKKSAPTGTKSAKGSLVAQKQSQRLAAAMDPNLYGKRAEAWVTMWDKGPKAARPQVLEALYRLHGSSNNSDLEADLGDAAPLFFTRLTSWLRLTYKMFDPPSEGGTATNLLWLVRALSIFVRGAQYATLLVESGVTGALTECLSCGTRTVPPALGTEERRAILLLLLYLANAGRVYREMVCDEEGLVQLLHTMQQEEQGEISLLLMDLLVVVGQGNPRMAPLVHTGMVRLILFRQADEVARFPGARQTRSETVVLQVARALREMQLARELQFYAGGTAGEVQSEHLLPVVGLNLGGERGRSAAEEPLQAEVTVEEYLAALLFLNLHDTNTSLRVEGNELLALAAKNTQLTARILNVCFDTMDDDHLIIADEDDVAAIAARQRHQLSCGRAVVQIIISTPMTKERRTIIINLIAMRSAHLTLLKYLRMSDGGDIAAVVDSSKALQLLAKAAEEQERRPDVGGGYVSLAKVGQSIHDAVGDSIYQVLLFQEISEEESFAILRAARATAAAAHF